jgi:hypothetical protein
VSLPVFFLNWKTLSSTLSWILADQVWVSLLLTYMYYRLNYVPGWIARIKILDFSFRIMIHVFSWSLMCVLNNFVTFEFNLFLSELCPLDEWQEPVSASDIQLEFCYIDLSQM